MNNELLLAIAVFAVLYLLNLVKEYRSTQKFIDTIRDGYEKLAKSYPEETKQVLGFFGDLLGTLLKNAQTHTASTPSMTDDFIFGMVKKWLGDIGVSALEEDTKEIPQG